MTKGKRDIGDPLDEVARTGKIGGRPSKSPDIQTSESSNLQNAEKLKVQTTESPSVQQSSTPEVQNAEISKVQSVEPSAIQRSEMLDLQTSEMVKGQNMNSLAVQESKGTHKGRTQKTIYLPPRLARRLDRRALDEDRERSEIVADALELYFKSTPLAQSFEDQE